jgi:hypothetical protein
VIFTLPNGLQGYMLVNAAGARIDAAPLAIVRDPRRRDAVVETGISCFGCHGSLGILRPRETDDVPVYADTHIADFLGRELDEIAATYPRQLRPDPFVNDARKYRAFVDTLEGGGPAAGAPEYSDFVALAGQYESNLGFHGAAAEFNESYPTFRDRVLANDFGNVALPRTATAPLVTRDNFVCVYRELVLKVRANAVFCAKTFDAAAVRDLCSGAGSSGPRPSSSPDAGAPEPARDAGSRADARNCRRTSSGRLVCS